MLGVMLKHYKELYTLTYLLFNYIKKTKTEIFYDFLLKSLSNVKI